MHHGPFPHVWARIVSVRRPPGQSLPGGLPQPSTTAPPHAHLPWPPATALRHSCPPEPPATNDCHGSVLQLSLTAGPHSRPSPSPSPQFATSARHSWPSGTAVRNGCPSRLSLCLSRPVVSHGCLAQLPITAASLGHPSRAWVTAATRNYPSQPSGTAVHHICLPQPAVTAVCHRCPAQVPVTTICRGCLLRLPVTSASPAAGRTCLSQKPLTAGSLGRLAQPSHATLPTDVGRGRPPQPSFIAGLDDRPSQQSATSRPSASTHPAQLSPHTSVTAMPTDACHFASHSRPQ
jgi:hypothetical protein